MSKPTPASGDAVDQQLQHWLLLAAILVGSVLCYRMAVPFLQPLALALVLAVLGLPLQEKLQGRFGHPSLAATASVLVIVIVIAIPSAFVFSKLAAQATTGIVLVAASIESGSWLASIESHPRLLPLAHWLQQQIDLPGTASMIAARVSETGGAFVRGSLRQLTGMVLTFYVLFYFLRDHQRALDGLRSHLPLTPEEVDKVFLRIGNTIQATVFGTLIVAAIQGTLGGLMFWWLDLPAPLLWGLVMAALAIVPILGAFIVWIPAAIYLGLSGHWGQALTLAIWGTVVVGWIDNLIYPILVGNRIKMHTVTTFIALVGGMLVFGPIGIVIGPIVVTTTACLLEIWRLRHGVDTGCE